MKSLLLSPLVFVRFLFVSAFLALGQIRANKTRAVLTTLGIIIGVASVTAVIATLSGMKTGIMSDFETFGTNKIYIWSRWPETGPLRRASWRQIRFQPEQFEGLLDHCPSVKHVCLASSAGTRTARYGDVSVDGVWLQGVEVSWIEIENRKIIQGRPFSLIDESECRNVCLIDTDLRDKLRLDTDCIGQVIYLGSDAFIVVGLLEKMPQTMFGGDSRGNWEAVIPFRTAQKLSDSWIRVTAACKSTELAEEARAEICFFLRKTRNIKPGEPDTFRIEVVASYVNQFQKTSMMITAVAGGIVSISLLVGGIGIMNIMLVSVSERTREIGLRKAVGAKNSAILAQFLVEAVVLCLIGGLMGIGVGYLLTKLISKADPVMQHTSIPLWSIMLSLGFSAFVGIFFGMFPAVKAARLDPIEALRHE